MSTVDCSYYVLSSLVYSTCRVEGIRLVHLVQCTIIIDDVGLSFVFLYIVTVVALISELQHPPYNPLDSNPLRCACRAAL
jgi:hypothetical protein